eukprot:419334-Pyramimonas_sp.AAC.1
MFGRLGGLLARLMPSEAVLGASLGRRGTFLKCSRAVLETILRVLKASWAVLRASWGRLGGLVLGAILEAPWAILGRSLGTLGPSRAVGRPKRSKCQNPSVMITNDSGLFEPSWGSS